jgi:signal transduction histidine kinase
MLRLRKFLRRHILWAGFFAVIVPLFAIIALQYRSLNELKKTSTVAENVWMKNYLADVSKEVKYFYKGNAEQALTTSASAIEVTERPNGKSLFGKSEVEGAKLLFVASIKGNDRTNVYFYDPSNAEKPITPSPAEARAVNLAMAPLRLLSEEEVPKESPSLMVDEYDPENRVVFKPIRNESRKVVGVTGLILDTEYFRTTYLPRVIQQSLPKFFPADAQKNIIVTVHDGKGNRVMATQEVQGKDDDTYTMMPFFSDWKVGIRSRYMTAEQWARWNFNVSLSLSALMTLVLMGGIVLALRTASREIRLSQMKTDFVSNVSHELRTPLSSIRVFGEFLKLGRVKDDEKIREYGEYIETESSRLTQLINNILDFSKIESGRKTYQFELANVEELIGETLRTFDVQLKQQGFGIIFETPRSPLPQAFVDHDALTQAFLNLLDNAVKYSGDAKQLYVRLGQKGEFLTLSVTDHGIGISKEEQAKIFEKFYRVGTGLVHDVKGNGLGLSLVTHIVKAHGGSVSVESDPGRGSTFTIHLPVAESTPEQESKKADRGIAMGEPSLSLDVKQ